MSELAAWIEKLRPPARAVSQNAHSPYSRLKVGAAVIGSNGVIHTGCNVESASFGLTQCAERNAIGAAIAAGAAAGSLQTLLVYSPGEVVHSPCGACRQVIHELMAEDALIISCCDGKDHLAWSSEDLLPDPFTLD